MLKKGCAYSNPSCGSLQECDVLENSCKLRIGVILCSSTPVVGLAIVALAIFGSAFFYRKSLKSESWSPKKIVALALFIIAGGTVLFLVVASVMCVPEASIFAIAMISLVCCLPVAIGLFIVGAFLWSGAKKDELRDLEI